jgi:hypothetical protein
MSRGHLTSSTMGAEWSVISQHRRNIKPLLTISMMQPAVGNFNKNFIKNFIGTLFSTILMFYNILT